MDNIIGFLVCVLLVLIIMFIVTRWFWCWYWKINVRLEEQKKTNELLEGIYAALIQGNTVNAVTAGQITSLHNTASGTTGTQGGIIQENEIPDI